MNLTEIEQKLNHFYRTNEGIDSQEEYESLKLQQNLLFRESQQELYELLKLLTPYDLKGYEKIRLGEPNDGGYVILDKLDGDTLLSFGVGNLVQFEEDLANKGYKVYLFDHSINELPKNHPNFKFFKEGINSEELLDLNTLDHYVARFNLTSNRMILKIDVEGSEYDVFESIDPALLLQFEQIIVEFHSLTELGHNSRLQKQYKASLEKLTSFFNIVHVHANCWGTVQVIKGFTIPDALEVTFVRRDIGKVIPSRTFYPTSLDKPNNYFNHDIPLSFFPFLPQ